MLGLLGDTHGWTDTAGILCIWEFSWTWGLQSTPALKLTVPSQSLAYSPESHAFWSTPLVQWHGIDKYNKLIHRF